jgi:hypothetical protein
VHQHTLAQDVPVVLVTPAMSTGVVIPPIFTRALRTLVRGLDELAPEAVGRDGWAAFARSIFIIALRATEQR